jgi:hypothetical protein
MSYRAPTDATEIDTARAIAAGTVPSGTSIGASALFALRISGTGMGYRDKNNEHVYRDPEHFLNDEFLARCGGLPITDNHPEAGLLNSDEHADRVLGSILLPYIAQADGIADHEGTEVWGIARVFNENAIAAMRSGPWSTSPAVVVSRANNVEMSLADGATLLLEGKPALLDHLAVCKAGVWDKGGSPSGVRADTISQESKMSETTTKEKETEGDPLAKILDCLGGITKRLDGLETHVAEQKSTAAAAEAERERIRSERAKSVVSDTPTTDDDDDDDENKRAALADAQMRADSVANVFGLQADKPMVGETPRNYRIRQLRRFQPHSKEFKETDLKKLDAPTLDAVERVIFADAKLASQSIGTGVRGQLIEVRKRDSTGRIYSEFFGDRKSWMDEFSMVPMCVTKINTGRRDDD